MYQNAYNSKQNPTFYLCTYVQEAAQMHQMLFTASTLLVASPTIYNFLEIIDMPRFRPMLYMENQK